MLLVKWFEASELVNLGWIQVTGKGEENIYFQYKDANGRVLNGFIKQ
jgi:hypothetical protein